MPSAGVHWCRRDQRQADARLRTEREPAQHLEMRGAGAQQDDFGSDRRGRLHAGRLQDLSRVAVRVRMLP